MEDDMSQKEKSERQKLTRNSLGDLQEDLDRISAEVAFQLIDYQIGEALAPPDLSSGDKAATERVDRLVGRWRAQAAAKIEEQRREIERLEKHIEILDDLFTERRNEATNPDRTRVPLKSFPPGPGTKGEDDREGHP